MDSNAVQVASHEIWPCCRAGAGVFPAVYRRGPGPRSVKTGLRAEAPPPPARPSRETASVKGYRRLCAQARFRLMRRGLQRSTSSARARFTHKPLISLAACMVIISPCFRNPTKNGAWNAPPTPSSTRLSTGRVDSLGRDDAPASGHAAKACPVKPAPERLCTAACAPVFPGEIAATRKPAPMFHAQTIDFKSPMRDHIFAIFPEPPVFRGVERAPHKAMHSVIHRVCG